MHTYSTDNDLRPKVYGGLALISYFFIIVGGYLVDIVNQSLVLNLMIGVPSWGAIFGVALTIFDRKLWNSQIARKLGATRVPDLNGKWDGWIKTSYKGYIAEEALHPDDNPDDGWRTLKVTLHIEQTWRKIQVHLETETSSSDSGGATLLTNEGKWPSLNYQYQNDPHPNTTDGMSMHHGTADLELKQIDGKYVLEGVYYTGPNRENHGRMRFEYVE